MLQESCKGFSIYSSFWQPGVVAKHPLAFLAIFLLMIFVFLFHAKMSSN
jgi:hypothetical protein